MPARIAKQAVMENRTASVELRIAVICETKAAVELNGAVGHGIVSLWKMTRHRNRRPVCGLYRIRCLVVRSPRECIGCACCLDLQQLKPIQFD